MPHLLVRQSIYFRELLAGEFQEALGRDEPRDELEAADDDNSAERDVKCIETWLDYFSDSDASYAEDSDDESDCDREHLSKAVQEKAVKSSDEPALNLGKTVVSGTDLTIDSCNI